MTKGRASQGRPAEVRRRGCVNKADVRTAANDDTQDYYESNEQGGGGVVHDAEHDDNDSGNNDADLDLWVLTPTT